MSEEAPPGNLREIGGGVEYYLKIRAGTFCSACDGKIATVFGFFFNFSFLKMKKAGNCAWEAEKKKEGQKFRGVHKDRI